MVTCPFFRFKKSKRIFCLGARDKSMDDPFIPSDVRIRVRSVLACIPSLIAAGIMHSSTFSMDEE